MCEFYDEYDGAELDNEPNNLILKFLEKLTEVKAYDQAFQISSIPEEIKSLVANNNVIEVGYDQGILNLQIDLRKSTRPMEYIFPKNLRPYCTYQNGEFVFKDEMNIPRFYVTSSDNLFNLYDNNGCVFVECKPIEFVSNIISDSLFTRNDHQQLCGMLRLALPSVEIKSYDYGSNQFSRFEYCDEGNSYSITVKNNKFYLFDGCNEEEFETIFGLLECLNYQEPRYL